MLELFPEQAAVIGEGQTIEATFKSQPGRLVHGRIAFIDPHVDSKSRTVRVRVVIDRVKAEIASLESELDGIPIVGVYDRTTHD